jgi:hypothetical protein
MDRARSVPTPEPAGTTTETLGSDDGTLGTTGKRVNTAKKIRIHEQGRTE